MTRSSGRDLPPPGGVLARLHLLAGDALIWSVALLRPRLMLGVRLVAFDAQGRVFLVRHLYRPGWHLPGGGVEAGETARAAALREAREEGGLVLEAPPALFGLYYHAATGRRDHVAVFVARAARQAAGAPRPGLEIRDGRFFHPDELPRGTTPATRARVAEAVAGAPASELW